MITRAYASPLPIGDLTANTNDILLRNINMLVRIGRLVHNHPSGDPSPSTQDVAMTREIMAIAKPLGVTVHDHIIVGRDGHASLKGLRLI